MSRLARLGLLVVVLYGLSMLAGVENSVAQPQPAQYFAGTGHWYQAVTTPEALCWEACRDSASRLGGYLATVGDDSENAFILSLGPAGTNARLGGWRSSESAPWQWVTGEEWSYNNWDTGEPGAPVYRYLMMWLYTGDGRHAGQWFDFYNCDPQPVGLNSFIVEYDQPADCSILHEHFSSDVFAIGDWTRSDGSVTVDQVNGWLHIASDGVVDDGADKFISLTLPITVETRMRLVSGGYHYTLPAIGFFYGPTNTQADFISYLPNVAPGEHFGWKFMDEWTDVHTLGPQSEGQWLTIKAVIRENGGELYAKRDIDPDFTPIVTRSWTLPDQFVRVAYRQQWDAACDIDYLLVTAADCGPEVPQPVYVDIKPQSCPNPFQLKPDGTAVLDRDADCDVHAATNVPGDRSVLPVAVLGAEGFDVGDIDPETIKLNGVPALPWANEDVSAPMTEEPDDCGCTAAGPDGFMDLTLKFSRAAIAATLGQVSDGEYVPLTLTGNLLDGTAIEGTDCIWIRVTGKGRLAGDDVQPFGLESYPNPFNAATSIRYTLNEPGDVVVSIYNVLGQHVATLVDEYQSAGQHTTTWDAGRAASGVYFYRLQVNGAVKTRQMSLIK